MTTLTYAGLKTQLGQYTRDDDPNSTPLLDTVIYESEELLSELMATLKQLQQSAPINLVVGQPDVTIPSTFRSSEHWTLTDGTRTHVIKQRTPQFIEQIYPFTTRTSRPDYYAIWNATTFRLAPTPDDTYPTILNFLAKWQHLSSTQTTTDLSTCFPELLRMACLSHWEIMRRRPEQRGDYEARFKTLLSAAGIADTAQRRDALAAHMMGVPAA